MGKTAGLPRPLSETVNVAHQSDRMQTACDFTPAKVALTPLTLLPIIAGRRFPASAGFAVHDDRRFYP
jgi:hypothetical protein